MGTVDKKIEKVTDLKGMKMRSQESEVHLNMWKALGVNPLPVSITETEKALQTGVVNGLDNSPMWFMTTGWYQSIQYLTVTEHIYQPGIMFGNLEFYKSLTKKQQKSLMDSRIGIPATVTKEVRDFEKSIFEQFKNAGIQISNMPQAERKKMKGLTKPVHKLFLDSTSSMGKKLYNLIEKSLK